MTKFDFKEFDFKEFDFKDQTFSFNVVRKRRGGGVKTQPEQGYILLLLYRYSLHEHTLSR